MVLRNLEERHYPHDAENARAKDGDDGREHRIAQPADVAGDSVH